MPSTIACRTCPKAARPGPFGHIIYIYIFGKSGPDQALDLVEIFSGEGHLSKAFRHLPRHLYTSAL